MVLDVELDWVLAAVAAVVAAFGGSGVGAEVEDCVLGWVGCCEVEVEEFEGSVVFAVSTEAVSARCVALVGVEVGGM